MPNILVRNVDPATHRELERRARSKGQSLQQFLTHELDRLASTPTVDDVFDALDQRDRSASPDLVGRVGLETAVDDLSQERDGR